MYACVISGFKHVPLFATLMGYSSSGFSVHGTLQVRMVEWFPCPSSGNLPDSGTESTSLTSELANGFFTTCATWEAPYNCLWCCSVTHHASLSITTSWSLLKLMSIESVMPLIISSSVVPFSFFSQSFPTSGSFPMSQFFASGDESIEASTSASILPMNIMGGFP